MKFEIWLCDAVILFCVHNLQFCVLLFSDSPFKYTGCQTGAALLGSELLQWKQPATQLLALQATPNAQKKWKNISVLWVWFGSRFHGYDLSQPGSSLNLCALSSSSKIRLPLSSIQQCFMHLSDRRNRPWTFEQIWTWTSIDPTHRSRRWVVASDISSDRNTRNIGLLSDRSKVPPRLICTVHV